MHIWPDRRGEPRYANLPFDGDSGPDNEMAIDRYSHFCLLESTIIIRGLIVTITQAMFPG